MRVGAIVVALLLTTVGLAPTAAASHEGIIWCPPEDPLCILIHDSFWFVMDHLPNLEAGGVGIEGPAANG